MSSRLICPNSARRGIPVGSVEHVENIEPKLEGDSFSPERNLLAQAHVDPAGRGPPEWIRSRSVVAIGSVGRERKARGINVDQPGIILPVLELQGLTRQIRPYGTSLALVAVVLGAQVDRSSGLQGDDERSVPIS